MTQTTAVAPSHQPTRDIATGSRRLERPLNAFLWLFAAVPAGLALLAAVRAPRMHVLLDYWHVLAKITDDSGHLLLGQVFTYHLDQPFVVPSLLFWADAAWFGGDNRALNVLTVLLVAGCVLALRTMLPTTLPRTAKTTVTAAASWLLLTSHAAELWLQGTNGISWVPAVFCCLLAAVLAHHGRIWAAGIAAVVGCLSFGAALPIWFVLALIAWLRNESRTRIAVLLTLGIVVVATWWLTKPSGPQSLASSAFDPDGRLSVVAAAVGGLWSADNAALAVLAGGAILALLALLCTRTTIDRRPSAGWIGVAAYALALALMVGLGRTTSQVPGGNVGLISRYVLISALATTALLALLALHRPQWPLRRLVVLAVATSLITHAIGGLKADNVRRGYAPLALAAIALRVDAPTVLDALRIQRGAAPAARALHAYPFANSFTLGCHGPELGQRIDGAFPVKPGQGEITSKTVTGDTVITGWATMDGTTPDCVLVADRNGTVVGGGVVGLPGNAAGSLNAPDGTGWQAVAAPGTDQLSVLAVKDGTIYRLPPANPPQ